MALKEKEEGGRPFSGRKKGSAQKKPPQGAREKNTRKQAGKRPCLPSKKGRKGNSAPVQEGGEKDKDEPNSRQVRRGGGPCRKGRRREKRSLLRPGGGRPIDSTGQKEKRHGVNAIKPGWLKRNKRKKKGPLDLLNSIELSKKSLSSVPWGAKNETSGRFEKGGLKTAQPLQGGKKGSLLVVERKGKRTHPARGGPEKEGTVKKKGEYKREEDLAQLPKRKGKANRSQGKRTILHAT